MSPSLPLSLPRLPYSLLKKKVCAYKGHGEVEEGRETTSQRSTVISPLADLEENGRGVNCYAFKSSTTQTVVMRRARLSNRAEKSVWGHGL